MVQTKATLIVVGGLPATGKTRWRAHWPQRGGRVTSGIDTIEQAIVDHSALTPPLGPAAYEVSYAITRQQLRLGLDVVLEGVNPLRVTRDAWRRIGTEAAAEVVEVELVCSDVEEHRRRAENRSVDVPGLALPRGEADLLRVRADLRREAQTAAVRGAVRPGHGAQSAGHGHHRRRRGHPRTTTDVEPAGRAPARLVPHHHAAHGDGHHGQVRCPALAAEPRGAATDAGSAAPAPWPRTCTPPWTTATDRSVPVRPAAPRSATSPASTGPRSWRRGTPERGHGRGEPAVSAGGVGRGRWRRRGGRGLRGRGGRSAHWPACAVSVASGRPLLMHLRCHRATALCA